MVESAPIPMGAIAALVLPVFMERTARTVRTEHDVNTIMCTNDCFTLILDVDECKNNPCKNGGNCTNTHGGHSCSCPSGFNGKNCENGMEQIDVFLICSKTYNVL